MRQREDRNKGLEQSQFFFSNCSLVCRHTGSWPYIWPGLKTPGPSHQCLRWLPRCRANDRRNYEPVPEGEEEPSFNAQLPFKGYRSSAEVTVCLTVCWGLCIFKMLGKNFSIYPDTVT